MDNSIESFVQRIKQKPLKQKIQVTDNGIYLKMLEINDKEKHYALIMKNKEYLSKTLPWAQSYSTIEDSIKFLAFFQAYHEEVSKIGYMVYDNDQMVGCIAYQELYLDKKTAEIGYWLSQDYCGKGIMTKSVKSLIDYGFQELELEKIIIKCIVSNEKSANVAIRLGFTEQEQEKNGLVLNGVSHDVRVFWLTSSNYLSQQISTQ